MSYQRVTYKPESAARSRSVILKNPVTAGWAIRGVEVDHDGVNIGDAAVSERIHLIDLSLVSRRTAMVMDNHYGMLVEA